MLFCYGEVTPRLAQDSLCASFESESRMKRAAMFAVSVCLMSLGFAAVGVFERRHHVVAAMVRSGETTARDLLDHYIARVERLDGPINAVVVRDFERARARAAALDAGGDRSAPLFGVPMTVKESLDVQGLPTTLGHLAMKDKTARVSSIAVRRMEVLVGLQRPV